MKIQTINLVQLANLTYRKTDLCKKLRDVLGYGLSHNDAEFCFSVHTCATVLGISVRQVRRRIRKLVELDHVRIVNFKRGNLKSYSVHLFSLDPIDDSAWQTWLDNHQSDVEHQLKLRGASDYTPGGHFSTHRQTSPNKSPNDIKCPDNQEHINTGNEISTKDVDNSVVDRRRAVINTYLEQLIEIYPITIAPHKAREELERLVTMARSQEVLDITLDQMVRDITLRERYGMEFPWLCTYIKERYWEIPMPDFVFSRAPMTKMRPPSMARSV